MPSIRMRTNAKVNLFLSVLGRRPDGYHEVETILHGIKLSDDIEVSPTDTGKLDIDMRFDDGLTGELPAPEDNVIWAVVNQLVERGALNEGLHVKLTKRIPIGAGLGGGSGNAAGVLVALNELWDTQIARDELSRIAGALGADVPYCIGGGTALATGRGEEITNLPAPDDMTFVLGMSNQPLYTRDIYARWENGADRPEEGSAPITLALGGGDVREIASLLHNDLEPAIFSVRPELEEKKQVLVDAGALGALISGSGPTVFGIAPSEDDGERIAREVGSHFDRTLVVRSQPECIERLDPARRS